MPNHIVTRESVMQALSNPNPAYVIAYVGRALVVLLDRQTREESATNTTREHNMRGFTGADARSGCIGAKYYIKHKTLQEWQIEQWTRPNKNEVPRLAKYWRQLDDEAHLKRAKQ